MACYYGGMHSNFASHSVRKLKKTEIASSVDGPPVIATLLRAGHSIGQVTQTYTRIAAGLMLEDFDIGILPPKFNMSKFPEGIDYTTFVPKYQLYPQRFMGCIPFIVANVCYQMPFIEKEFPRDHYFFNSTLYKSGFYNTYKFGRTDGILVGRMKSEVTNMQATEIPAYICQGVQL